MEIKVLGTGCAGCKVLHETVKQEDIMKIMSYNVMALPALVVDEQVVAKGRKLSLAEVKELLTK